MKRSTYRWLVPALALPCLLVAGLAWVTTSTQGAGWSLQLLGRLVPGLSISDVQGTWRGGLTIGSVRYQADDIALAIEQLNIALQLRRLGLGAITLTHLDAATVVLTLQPSGSDDLPARDRIALPAVAMPVALTVPRAAVQRIVITQGKTRVQLNDMDVGLAWRGHRLRWRELSLRWDALNAQSSGELALDGAWPLQMVAALEHSAVPGSLTVRANGDLGDLEVAADLNGPYPLQATGRIDLLNPAMPLSLDGQLREPLEWRDHELSIAAASLHLAGNRHRLSGMLQAAVQLPDFGASELIVPLSWEGQELAFAPRLALGTSLSPDGHPPDDPPPAHDSGVIELTCALGATTPYPMDCSGELDTINLTPWLGRGSLSGVLQTAVSGWQPLALSLRLPRLHGSLYHPSTGDRHSIEGRLAISSEDGRLWRIQDTELRLADNHLAISGTLAMDGGKLAGSTSQADGNLEINLNANQLDVLNRELSGELQAHAMINRTLSRADIELDAKIADLRYGATRVERATATIRLSELAHESSKAQLSFSGLELDSTRVGAGTATLQGRRNDHQIALRLDEIVGQANTELDCHGQTADFSGWRLRCDRWTTVVQTAMPWRWQLAEPLKLAWSGSKTGSGQASAQPFCLTSDSSELCLISVARWEAGTLENIHLKGSALELSRFVDQLSSSSTTGNLKLIKSPQAEFLLHLQRLAPLALTGTAHISPSGWRWLTPDGPETGELDAITLSLQASERRAHLELVTGGAALGELRIALDIAEPRGARRLDGRIDLEELQLGPFGWLAPDLEWSGALAAAIDLGGTLTEPTIGGEATLREGRLLVPPLGQPFEAISLHMRFDQSRALFDGEFTLAPGSGHIDGRIDWGLGNSTEPWRLSMNVTGSQLQIEPLPASFIRFSPTLKLAASPGLAQVTGRITVDEADLRIKSLPPDAADVSPDAEWVGARPDTTGPLRLEADIAVDLGQKVHFEGFGADVWLSGGLRFRHTPQLGPRLHGEVEVPRGRYRAYGQRLIVRKGAFIFVGPPANPDLNLEAIRELPPTVHDQVVGLRISGSLRNPAAQLFAEPTMPESDIAYYLLTGRPPPAAGATGQISATGALLSLGIAGSGDQAERLAGRFGITDFQISTYETSTGTQAAVSGYLTPRLYVRYGTGIQDRSNSITFQYRLTKKLVVEAISGVEEALDVLYSFTID